MQPFSWKSEYRTMRFNRPFLPTSSVSFLYFSSLFSLVFYSHLAWCELIRSIWLGRGMNEKGLKLRKRKIVDSINGRLLTEFRNKADGTRKISLFNYIALACTRQEFTDSVEYFRCRRTISGKNATICVSLSSNEISADPVTLDTRYCQQCQKRNGISKSPTRRGF